MVNDISSVSVGVASIDGNPDRVAIVLNGVSVQVVPELARQIAIQLIMTADYLDPPEEKPDDL